jgi:hypothetical protein
MVREKSAITNEIQGFSKRKRKYMKPKQGKKKNKRGGEKLTAERH